MKLTHTVLTGAALLFAVASHANTTNVGVISSAQTYSSGSATFAAGTPVDDLWTFDLSGGAYEQTDASGVALSGATGQIVGGSLEESNTDIATEFTKLIVTQQAYSANTKVITTSNQMSQDLLNIIR